MTRKGEVTLGPTWTVLGQPTFPKAESGKHSQQDLCSSISSYDRVNGEQALSMEDVRVHLKGTRGRRVED